MIITSALVAEMPVNVTSSSPSSDCSHSVDSTTQTSETPGLKTFTEKMYVVPLE